MNQLAIELKDGFLFRCFFAEVEENIACIPLYYNKSLPPKLIYIEVGVLIDNIKQILPKGVDKELKFRTEILFAFWDLIALDYTIDDYSLDFEAYVALLSFLDISILNAMGFNVNLKMLIERNKIMLRLISHKYSIPMADYFFIGGRKTNFSLVFSNFPIIVTENLILRPFTTEDTNDLFHILNDEDYVEEFNPLGGEISWTEAYHNILQFQQNFLQEKSIAWAITKKATGEIIGVRDLFFDSPREPVVTQGFFFYEHRNRGYNQEVLATIIKFLQKVNSPYLMLNCKNSNAVVIHIANKLKFIDMTSAKSNEQERKQFCFVLSDVQTEAI